MTGQEAATMVRVSHEEWRKRSELHRERARRFTRGVRWRRDRGEPHPIHDFLFQYYPFPLSLLEEWHPGFGFEVEWPPQEASEVMANPFSPKYHRWEYHYVRADPSMISGKERARMWWMVGLLENTAAHAPNFGCHGLHEWAMVYQGTVVRHEQTLHLRLKQEEIDRIVEERPIACSHYDAFRFFAPHARVFNRLQPALESRMEMEQPACIHANMDLYKWSAKSMPWVGSDLLMDCFDLALDLRDLDMRASPYDLSPYGLEAVRIETTDGRKQYEGLQRQFAARAAVLRARLTAALRRVLTHPANPASA